MRTLVIDTATAACSVALIEGDRVVDARHAVVGRGHAEQLVPMIAALDRQGRADRILVDVGPGSFTGVRVGLAAARGLAIGWDAAVDGFSSLALVAAGALCGHDAADAAAPDSGVLAVVLEGGHGEVFVQRFGRGPLAPLDAFASLKPAAALERLSGVRRAVGSGVHHLAALDACPTTLSLEALLPDARHAVHLPATLAGLPPRPLYGRAPDAKPRAATAAA